MARDETGQSDNPLDLAIEDLKSGAEDWARSDIASRIRVLNQIKDNLLHVSAEWARVASRGKQIPEGSPLEGEEWISGPYALMSACNGLIRTLEGLQNPAKRPRFSTRTTGSGQLAVNVVPSSVWDHLLLSGVSAEVWMQKGVTAENLPEHTAEAYKTPAKSRAGVVSLVLGAGNIASIAPLDCFQKLFVENQVVILKLNPVNDYLYDVLTATLKPLIASKALRIVKGDGATGAYLCTHPDIAEIHITGAGATHDLIVWGAGKAGEAARKSGKPVNTRRMTSELGAVCPTIVVPGPWSKADIAFQADQLATQKMHNSGFNCVACQVLVMSKSWDLAPALLAKLQENLRQAQRPAYYPKATERLDDFAAQCTDVTHIKRGAAPDALINEIGGKDDKWFETNEIFAPALSRYEIDEADPEAFLRHAIAYANDQLHGTLGGNILIHPKTIRQIGKARFEELIAEFRYGCIAINSWTGVGFLQTKTPWGAFPGHTPEDVQSGIGFVHNTYMFDRPERTIVQQPWRPFPRGVLSGQFTLLPKPPWFISNRRQHVLGRLLTRFEHRPSLLKLPRIFLNAMLG